MKSIASLDMVAVTAAPESSSSTGVSDTRITYFRNNILLAHGIFLSVLFGVIVPFSILAAYAKRSKIHQGLQVATLLMFSIAMILAFAHEDYDDEDGGAAHLQVENDSITPHVYLGIFIMIIFYFQYFLGIIKFIVSRVSSLNVMCGFAGYGRLRLAHKVLGYGLASIAIMQVFVGWAAYSGSCGDGGDGDCAGHWIPGAVMIMSGYSIVGIRFFRLSLTRSLEFISSAIFVFAGLILIAAHPQNVYWGVTNVVGGALGLALETEYVKTAFLPPVTQTEKLKNKQPALNFFPALLIFLDGFGVLYQEADGEFFHFLRLSLGFILVLLSCTLLLSQFSSAPIFSLLSSFLLVLVGVFFFGISDGVQDAADEIYESWADYVVVLVCLGTVTWMYGGLFMVLAKKWKETAEGIEDYQLQDQKDEEMDGKRRDEREMELKTRGGGRVSRIKTQEEEEEEVQLDLDALESTPSAGLKLSTVSLGNSLSSKLVATNDRESI